MTATISKVLEVTRSDHSGPQLELDFDLAEAANSYVPTRLSRKLDGKHGCLTIEIKDRASRLTTFLLEGSGLHEPHENLQLTVNFYHGDDPAAPVVVLRGSDATATWHREEWRGTLAPRCQIDESAGAVELEGFPFEAVTFRCEELVSARYHDHGFLRAFATPVTVVFDVALAAATMGTLGGIARHQMDNLQTALSDPEGDEEGASPPAAAP